MVRFACLLVLLVPLVACGSANEMMMNNYMAQMMAKHMGQMMMGNQMMNGMNGYGGGMSDDDDKHMGGAQSPEDYEAYLKWCEERKMNMMQQKQQKELMMEFEKAMEEKKREKEHDRIQEEQKERRESMMAKHKMYKEMMEDLEEYDETMHKFTEMKHAYMFGMTMEVLKFCKCSDFTDDLKRYFMHGDMGYSGEGHMDLDDMMEGFDLTNAQDVARTLANKPQVDQVKAFFGGLAYSMCQGGRAYVEQVRQMENQYRFMERLM